MKEASRKAEWEAGAMCRDLEAHRDELETGMGPEGSETE